MSIKIIEAYSIKELEDSVKAVLTESCQPIGPVSIVSDSLIFRKYAQAMGDTSTTSVYYATDYRVIERDSPGKLRDEVVLAFGAGFTPLTGVILVGNDSSNRHYLQVVGRITSTGGGGGGSVTQLKTINGTSIVGPGDLVIDPTFVSLGNVDNTSDVNKPVSTAMQTELAKKADLDANGKVLASQIPAGVDEVSEFDTFGVFPPMGETSIIYLDKSTGIVYRWGGSTYVEISSTIALGTTSTTAFRGDQGLTAYNHVSLTGNVHSLAKSDLPFISNVDNTSDADKPISTAAQTALATKADLDVNGKLVASQLPASVDEVSEFNTFGDFPTSGVETVIYLDKQFSKIYRWNGTTYVEISPSIALGTTSTTAFRGDQGLTAYNHVSATGNVHSLAKSDLPFISNVDNTSDVDKPISSATQAALNTKADLDANGKVLASQIPAGVDEVSEFDTFGGFPPIGEASMLYLDRQFGKIYRWSGSTYVEISSTVVIGTTSTTAFRGDQGLTAYNHVSLTGNVHSLAKSDLPFISNVDNTSDADKPISTATQAALNAKLGLTENATSATKLASAVAINGVNFDGSSAITVKASTPSALTISPSLVLDSGTTFDGSTPLSLGLPNIGTAGVYGSATSSPIITTDSFGRVTNVSTTPLTQVIRDESVFAIQAQGVASTVITTTGGTAVAVGTATAVALAATAYGRVRKVVYATAAAANSVASLSGQAAYSLAGGFKFTAVWSLHLGAIANTIGFIGLRAAALTNQTLQLQTNVIGVGFNAAATNYSSIASGATAPGAIVDLGATMAIGAAGVNMFKLDLDCAPGATSVSLKLTNLTTGVSVSSTLATSLPVAGTFLIPTASMLTTAALSIQLGVSRLYISTVQ